MLKVSSDADNSKLFPIVWRRDPGSGSDVGFADDLRSQESNSMLMRFVQDGSIVPEPCRLWISPGTFSTLRLKRVGLSIRHFDELLYRGSLKPFAGIASGEVIDGNSSRTVSRLRLDLSWRAVRRALLDSTKRGHSTLGIRFGETSYWVPPVSLGECSWKHQ
jgi:hypothetical protein